MTRAEITERALRLHEQERFELIDTLWARVVEPPAVPHPLPEWQKQLLEERLEASAGEDGEDWERVKAESWPETR